MCCISYKLVSDNYIVSKYIQTNVIIIMITGIDGQTTVTIVSTPAGTPVSGSTNTFDYPILSSVTLTCNVTSSDGSTPTVTGYSWDTTGCFADDRGMRRCFPVGQTTQSVSEDDVFAKDAGTVRCTAVIGSDSFTSEPFTLRISGMFIVVFACTLMYLL